MKIGLLTVYYANYGSYYQANSLVRQLESMGHECELINASIRGRHVYKFLLGALGEHVLPKAITDRVAEKVIPFRTYHAMRPELDKLNIGPLVFDAKKLNDRYDCVLVGSDELWSSTNPVMFFIPAYFGLGIDIPLISYSTSAVTMHNPAPEIEAQISKGLSKFASISVRDQETHDWVQKWTGRDTPITLDPTLLNPYFGSNGVGGNGIMVYGEDYSEQHIALIRKFAKENNYTIHALCWPHDWCDDFVDVTSATQLQQSFASADFCAVSTFHGTVFSLLNHRPFAAFSAHNRTAKINRLLTDLDMLGCFWDEGRTDELAFMSDYDTFERNVGVLRQHSLAYLGQALRIAEEQKKH